MALVKKIPNIRGRVPRGDRPSSSRRTRECTSSRLRRRRHCLATGAPQARDHRAEGDGDGSVRPSLHDPHVETATGPDDDEVEVYRGEDALQENLPYPAVPSEDEN